MSIRAVPATAPFMPTNITGCRAWFDAFDASYTLSGTTVTGWTNKSGNANASTGSGTVSINLATLNGKSSVRFPAGTNYLNVGSLTYTTSYRNIFFVVTVGPTGSIYVYLTTNNDLISGQCYSWSDGDIEIDKWGTLGLLSYPTGYFGTTSFVSICTSTGGNTGIWVNGVSQTLTNNNVGTGGFWSTGTASPSLGGASGYTTGTLDMYELLQYDGSLTTTQRQNIEGYLAWKWGLQASLPAGHPYASINPNLTVNNKISALPFYTQFKPTSIAGCALWLDGEDPAGTGTPPSNGATVTTWVDKSGNSANGTSIGTPTYSSSSKAISFNGSSAFSLPNGTISPGSSNFTIFGVCYPTSFANYPYLYGAGGSSAGTATGMLFYPSGQIENGFYTDFMGIAPSGTVAINNLYLISTAYNGTRTLYINGTSVVSGTPSSTKNVSVINNFVGRDQINNNEFFYGTINEFIVFNTFITSTQRQSVESYLAAKWGLTAALPTFTSPLSISGCQLWMDGADSTTITIATGVSQWNDKSGNAYNFTQATGALQPTRTGNYLNFQSNYYLTIPTAFLNNITSWSLFFLINPISSSNFIMVKQHDGVNTENVLSMTLNTNSSGGGQTGSTGYLYWRSYNAGTQAASSSALSTSTIQIISLVYDGTNLYMYINGTLNSTTAGSFATLNDTLPTAYTLGAWYVPGYGGFQYSGSTNFQLGEMISYYTSLTTAQRQQVEGYLAWKWGIKGSPQGIVLSVTNSGSGAYLINGASNPTLSFVRGNIYILNVNASGHPFWIQTVSGAYSSGNVYSTGVTNNGTQNGTIIFEVPSNAPQLYYVCQNHSSMAGSIVVSDGLPATHPHFAANPYHPHFTAPAGRNPIVAALIPAIPRGIGYVKITYPTTTIFTYTGANQSLLIPASISPATITVYIWGAGGGGGHTGTQGATAGGAGAYVQGTLTVTPNNSLTIIVGGGGAHGTTGSAYGGGGSANAGGTYGGGGGRSAIQLSGTELVNAGGGGGAGYDCSGGYANFSPTINGGAGYPGLTGASWPFDSGAGGTQTAGGAGGPGNASSYGVASPGTYLAGGAAAPYAGGGGSGYYGGGGGNTNDTNGAGGGGGSSYTTNPAFTLITGSNSSNGYSAPASASPYYVSGVAAGSTNMTTGGNGRIVVTYTTIIPPTISSGGTITLNGTNRVHSFTTVGTTQFTLSGPASVQAQLLVVGGGGSGGGYNDGGGGGAGGLVYLSSMTLTAGTYSIVVGAGGIGTSGGYNTGAGTGSGNSGGNSSAFGYIGLGGGGGGYDGSVAGGSGGCGGGGGYGTAGGAATQVGGYAGGDGSRIPPSTAFPIGGGGGGMGGVGTTTAGGPGLQYSISGTAQFYAAGGGSGTDSTSVQVTGGSGIGGNGGYRLNTATNQPTAGSPNTGSGGGALSQALGGFTSGAGGSGIVIISFPN